MKNLVQTWVMNAAKKSKMAWWLNARRCWSAFPRPLESSDQMARDNAVHFRRPKVWPDNQVEDLLLHQDFEHSESEFSRGPRRGALYHQGHSLVLATLDQLFRTSRRDERFDVISDSISWSELSMGSVYVHDLRGSGAVSRGDFSGRGFDCQFYLADSPLNVGGVRVKKRYQSMWAALQLVNFLLIELTNTFQCLNLVRQLLDDWLQMRRVILTQALTVNQRCPTTFRQEAKFAVPFMIVDQIVLD